MDSNDYGSFISPLLAAAPLGPLGPGRADAAARAKLTGASSEEAFAPRGVVDSQMGRACIAGLLLMYDCLDESHEISQSIETASGSYWHGILHRREPDYGNAKYWFRRVGRHPVFEPLAAAARELAAAEKVDRTAEFLKDERDWDPFRFVDLCEAAAGGRSTSDALCRQIQKRECELLFEFCFKAAVGE
jgi:hypothetical protein